MGFEQLQLCLFLIYRCFHITREKMLFHYFHDKIKNRRRLSLTINIDFKEISRNLDSEPIVNAFLYTLASY